MTYRPKLIPPGKTYGPKRLTGIETTKVIEVFPALCEKCRRHIGLGLVLFEGTLHYTLGCVACKDVTLYRPKPKSKIPEWLQRIADADNNGKKAP